MMTEEKYKAILDIALSGPPEEMTDSALHREYEGICLLVTLWPLMEKAEARPELWPPELVTSWPVLRQALAGIAQDAGFELNSDLFLTLLDLGIYHYKPRKWPA